jgi:hyperosmotically inducible protein
VYKGRNRKRRPDMKTKMWVMTAVLLVLSVFLLVGATSVLSAGKARSAGLSDETIKAVVESRLVTHGLLTDDNIQVIVKDDSIVLRGTVPSLADKAKAQHDAQEAEEHHVIVNELAVAPSDLAPLDLADAVARKIREDLFYTVFDWVKVEYRGDAVTLLGWASEPWHRSEYVEDAKEVPGVVKLVDDIKVLPVSIFDNELRVKAARLIYRHALFESYRTAIDPPVHVIVENGRVILEGAVGSDMEKLMAGNLVREYTDAFSVQDDLEVLKK